MAPVISHARRRCRYVRLQQQQKSDRISRLNAKHAYRDINMHSYMCICMYFLLALLFCCNYSPCALALSFCCRSFSLSLSLSPDAIQNLPLPFANFVRSHNLNGIIYIFYLVPFPALISPLLAASVAAATTTTTTTTIVVVALKLVLLFGCFLVLRRRVGGRWHRSQQGCKCQSCSQSCWLSSLPDAVPVPCFYLPWRMRNKYNK